MSIIKIDNHKNVDKTKEIITQYYIILRSLINLS